jgi:poly(3-hydroxybutyrate) depolymerase
MGTGGAVASTGCGKTTWPASDMTYTIDVSGTSRSYILSLPANYDNTQPHQLVFAWHGRTGTAMQIANGRFYNLKMAGRMPNAIFVAGQGLGTTTAPTDTGWPNTNGQDIAFVRAALTYLNANLCVDQARVFSVGFSYGGIMSHTIGCQMSDTFRAIAPIAGARFGGGGGGNTCLTRPIAAWMTHGMLDSQSSGGVDFTAGESARDRVVTLNHCTTTTAPVDPSPCVVYQGCDAGYPVQWCPHTGAHTIPSFAAAAIATFFNQF